MVDLTGSRFAGMPGLHVSTGPYGGAPSLSAEDLPGQARIMAEAPKAATGPKKPLAGLLPMRSGHTYSITIKRAAIPYAEGQRKIAAHQRALNAARQKEHTAKIETQILVNNQVDPAKLGDTVVAYVDSTIALPIVTSYLLSKRKPRKLKRLLHL